MRKTHNSRTRKLQYNRKTNTKSRKSRVRKYKKNNTKSRKSRGRKYNTKSRVRMYGGGNFRRISGKITR